MSESLPDLRGAWWEFVRLCGENGGLSRKRRRAIGEERAAIDAKIAANREAMRAYGIKAVRPRRERRTEVDDAAEEAVREARRRQEGYW